MPERCQKWRSSWSLEDLRAPSGGCITLAKLICNLWLSVVLPHCGGRGSPQLPWTDHQRRHSSDFWRQMVACNLHLHWAHTETASKKAAEEAKPWWSLLDGVAGRSVWAAWVFLREIRKKRPCGLRYGLENTKDTQRHGKNNCCFHHSLISRLTPSPNPKQGPLFIPFFLSQPVSPPARHCKPARWWSRQLKSKWISNAQLHLQELQTKFQEPAGTQNSCPVRRWTVGCWCPSYTHLAWLVASCWLFVGRVHPSPQNTSIDDEEVPYLHKRCS